jgi:nitrogen fixation NifU-like protein
MLIQNTQIVAELSLPPVKIHCSVLAEDAIKSAINDYKSKQGAGAPQSQTPGTQTASQSQKATPAQKG